MKAPIQSKKAYLLASLLPGLLLLAAGCTNDGSPREIFIEAIGNFVKGLIDVGVATALGN